jgi:S-adenosylmethionine hydrolase
MMRQPGRSGERLEFGMPTIALLSDFGLVDHYVGAMKGAVLTVCPDATLVDVVHELPAHDVEAGALALDASYRHFPAGTVFLAVVDPGVGTERRPVALGAGRWLFVGPDNGLFTLVLETHPHARVHLLANPMLYRLPVSPVFHGRDLFAPTAGHLARGLPLEEVGPRVEDPVRLAARRATRTGAGLEGTILRADRFGNLVTSVAETDLEALAGPDLGRLEVVMGGTSLPFVRAYGEVGEGSACALLGSSGRLEIAVNRGRADALPGSGRGQPVLVRRP